MLGADPHVTRRDFLLNLMPEGSICAEIGVFKGEFSSRIFQLVKPQRLHLIDPWKYEQSTTYEHTWYGGRLGMSQANMDHMFYAVAARFKHQRNAGTASIHRMESATAAGLFSNDYFDWVYIDGNHSYDYVRADLLNFYPKVKTGGFITGDDYGSQGWWGDGVTRAVDEFRRDCTTVLIQSSQFILQKT